MPARTRRSAAVAAAAALVADMQMDSEPEVEEEQDAEGEDEEQEVEEGDEDEDAEAEDSQSGEEEDEGPAVATPTQPRLKITLKLPANTTSSNSAGTATPDDAEMDYAAFKRTPKRRAKTKVIQDLDVESEDPSSHSGGSDDEQSQDAPSRSTGTPSASTKPMTTRQAVLASVVDPSHVSLDEGTRSKKQPLNETELALRREETARKRKNLSEKKLEDEKAETINRLLKKQSRPKNKRNNTMDDRSPMPSASGSRTPKIKAKNAEDAEDAEGEEDEDDAMDVVEPQEEIKPVMYRWVSSLHSVPGDGEQKVELGITFSVPEVFFRPPPSQPESGDIVPEDAEQLEKIRKARGPGICAVEGCGKPRKYRLPKDWTIGACDSTHLRVIANQV
ncbi:hypothetical protein GALMADRAFT_237115 [Galerina marginata CBS 339.88]|uniref:INO80 complex subunit B-like conserved region domain-containing protein n=1 Tax=Galerina marginata (strain CBS 339.88) TaxID=685588 RepID=A0A067TWI3_GALM3|nr:hypothetical protein GALMADRAFT_237115 [Galerina marginata CBS 339.88]